MVIKKSVTHTTLETCDYDINLLNKFIIDNLSQRKRADKYLNVIPPPSDINEMSDYQTTKTGELHKPIERYPHYRLAQIGPSPIAGVDREDFKRGFGSGTLEHDCLLYKKDITPWF